MNTIIVYDSQFGNTEKVAQAIAEGASLHGEAKAIKATGANQIDWKSLDALIVGSPTQGGMPTQSIRDFLKSIPQGVLEKIKIAGFDTRFNVKTRGFGLKLLMNTIKYAAEKIAKQLKDAGGKDAIAEGFFVNDKEGPLFDGELERAKEWGKTISSKQ